MKILKRPQLTISMFLAVLSASALIFLNETSIKESTNALANMRQAQQTGEVIHQLMQNILNAETGQQGYLLTGNATYLEPYNDAMGHISKNLKVLHQFVKHDKDDLTDFGILSQHIASKLAVMDVSVRMGKEDKVDAWQPVLNTGVGKEQMDAIRVQSGKLSASVINKETQWETQITQSLKLSRIGIAILSLIGLLAFYMYLLQTKALMTTGEREQDALQREREQLDRLVQERTAKLAKLATHLQTVREDERGDLARELHDELGALLTAVKLDVARLKSRLVGSLPEAAERFEHLTNTLNSIIAMTRRIVEDLRPSSLSHLGLMASLEILAREFAETSGLSISTDLENVDLGGSGQLTIYRLVQESLTNIGKYAQAPQVKISLHNFDGYIIVEVKDNGKGFELGNVGPASHGLEGMRHRVEAAGGRLTVASAEGRGTLISAMLPNML